MTARFDVGGVSIATIEYASQGSAVLGIRDSGKSYTATAIAEHLMDGGIPITAFDPIGIWRFLRVPGAQWRILAALIRAYPAAVTRDRLATLAEQSATSSGYANNLGALRTLGFIDYPERGTVVALPVLFVGGRRG